MIFEFNSIWRKATSCEQSMLKDLVNLGSQLLTG